MHDQCDVAIGEATYTMKFSHAILKSWKEGGYETIKHVQLSSCDTYMHVFWHIAI